MKHLKRAAAMLAAMVFATAILPLSTLAATLEVGSRGDDVTKVQKKLIQYGYMTGPADGRYGEKTRDAVEWFQRRNGLTVDGKVGDDTAAALGVTLGKSASGGAAAAASASVVPSFVIAKKSRSLERRQATGDFEPSTLNSPFAPPSPRP
jgi:N-acetylmuramoyl-L-alanine amidase